MDIYDDFGPDATAPAPRKPSKARRARDDDDDDDFGLKVSRNFKQVASYIH